MGLPLYVYLLPSHLFQKHFKPKVLEIRVFKGQVISLWPCCEHTLFKYQELLG